MDAEEKDLIEEFQCPGCVCGSDTDCKAFVFESLPNMFRCKAHVPGTTIAPGGRVSLGLPKGFNKVGLLIEMQSGDRSTNIRFMKDPLNEYDHLNVPVWAMEKDGFLFVRTMCPRLNYTYVDIIKNGKINTICPQAIDVADFIEEID